MFSLGLKVEVCRGQLFTKTGVCIELSNDPPDPPADWRESCARILGKKV